MHTHVTVETDMSWACHASANFPACIELVTGLLLSKVLSGLDTMNIKHGTLTQTGHEARTGRTAAHFVFSHAAQQEGLPLLPLGHGSDIAVGDVRVLQQALVLYRPLLQVCIHEV